MRYVNTHLESLQRCRRTGASHALIALTILGLVELLCLRHCRALFSVFPRRWIETQDGLEEEQIIGRFMTRVLAANGDADLMRLVAKRVKRLMLTVEMENATEEGDALWGGKPRLVTPDHVPQTGSCSKLQAVAARFLGSSGLCCFHPC